MSMCNNILCHNNIAAGVVSCRDMLSGLATSRYERESEK